ncbi:UDP-glycosyltransferase [Ladona fulva]|uniref:UDP-glycosyltransferase n=1 Tax=Ladona fulva TaxID=123851 RepID=A0A8K0P036_LADFU|nr:UDP-glycosyltransferase [Ladona fulva]
MMDATYNWWFASAFVLILVLQPEISESANILSVFPFASRSHNNVYGTIIKALADKGHSFTSITSQPLNSPPPGFKQIDFSDVANKHLNLFSNSTEEKGMLEVVLNMKEMGDDICRSTLFHPEVKKLLNPSKNSERFDLILTSTFLSECFYGLAHINEAPIVLLCPTGPFHITYNTLGILGLPSFISNIMNGYTDHMTFPQRVINTVITYGHMLFNHYYILKDVDSIMKEAYGKNIPLFSELEKNISLVLVNHHFSLNGGRPLVPNLIEMGGLHIKPPKELPKDLKMFMDGASEHGIIYVSFGSILKSSNFPVEVRDAFIGAFSQLKQTVLWKWEGESPLPGQTKNIRLEKWLPQQDVFAHPKVKLFITHGGLLSMQEAASRGVPLIGIPFYGDQFYNLERAEELQIGVKLNAKNITKENLLNAINKVLGDPMYENNMKNVMSVMADQKEHPLERAIYWIEYVMRHKGAKHMRPASADLKWYQLYMLDVLFVLTVIPMALLSLTLYILLRLIRKFSHSKEKTRDSLKKSQ